MAQLFSLEVANRSKLRDITLQNNKNEQPFHRESFLLYEGTATSRTVPLMIDRVKYLCYFFITETQYIILRL